MPMRIIDPIETDHLPDIEAIMAQDGRLILAHQKWLIAEVKRLRGAPPATKELVDALKEMLALWDRVHGAAIIGRPTINAVRKALVNATVQR